MLDKIKSKIRKMFKSGFCIRSRHHNYLQTTNVISDEIIVKYHDGRIEGWNVLQYLYVCQKCGKHKYFTIEKWGKEEMKYFNKCRRGDCV